MFRRKLTLGIAIAALISSAIMVPANAGINTQQVFPCGYESESLCIESVEISLDAGATFSPLAPNANWINLGKHFVAYDLAGTSYTSPVSTINAIGIYAHRTEGRLDETFLSADVNSLQIEMIAGDTSNFTSWGNSFTGQNAFDPKVSFRVKVRAGSMVSQQVFSQGRGTTVDVLAGPNFNTFIFQGYPIQKAAFFNQDRERCASPNSVSDRLQNHFLVNSNEYLQPHSFRGITVADSSGVCGGSIMVGDEPGNPYNVIYLKSAGPHFYPDGSTLNVGHFEIALSADFLSRMLGMNQSIALAGALVANIKYDNSGESPVTSSIAPEGDGGVRLILTGFHYSEPTIVVKRVKPGKPIFKAIDAHLPLSTVRSSAQIAQIFGLSVIPKSKLTLTVSGVSSKSKICRLSGGKLITLKKTGTCTATIKIQPPKPPITKGSGSISVSVGQIMSGVAVAQIIGLTTPPKSKVTISLAKDSKKLCQIVGGRLKARSSTTCNVTVKIAAPLPPAFAQTSSIAVG